MDTTIQREKLEQARGILEEQQIDCWLTFARETSETPDPVMTLTVGHTSPGRARSSSRATANASPSSAGRMAG